MKLYKGKYCIAKMFANLWLLIDFVFFFQKALLKLTSISWKMFTSLEYHVNCTLFCQYCGSIRHKQIQFSVLSGTDLNWFSPQISFGACNELEANEIPNQHESETNSHKEKQKQKKKTIITIKTRLRLEATSNLHVIYFRWRVDYYSGSSTKSKVYTHLALNNEHK